MPDMPLSALLAAASGLPFETTWVSLKAEGPKFSSGDTRPNRVYIEQLFCGEL